MRRKRVANGKDCDLVVERWVVKGLSHEIKIGCRRYGCLDLYVERYC
jgi:hypothetical protein